HPEQPGGNGARHHSPQRVQPDLSYFRPRWTGLESIFPDGGGPVAIPAPKSVHHGCASAIEARRRASHVGEEWQQYRRISAEHTYHGPGGIRWHPDGAATRPTIRS